MAGLEPLLAHIYHEEQQAGSMLCAQHALNSLLQGHYFTAPDLSEIARNLDNLEQSYNEDLDRASTNMDDTGFFSVQVLDDALKVWGLNLVRWRSEAMRPYQGKPHTQLAFILNLHEHWYTLRRFGQALPNVALDPGDGHWFNLNSSLPNPVWVGKLYLGMVLQQAETDGYSVFAVTQADPEAPLALSRTEADMIASTLPEPTSSNTGRFRSGVEHLSRTGAGTDAFDEEDYELQAALQASLMSTSSPPQEDDISPPPLPRPMPAPLPSVEDGMDVDEDEDEEEDLIQDGADDGSSTPPLVSAPPAGLFLPGHADVDPVTASMERNRVLLQRMREQQEFAQRELWSEVDLTEEEQTALEERRRRRQQEEEQEAAQLRRAIEESEAMALEQGRRAAEGLPTEDVHHHGMEDEDLELQEALNASLAYMHAMETPSSSTDESQQKPQSTDTESVVSESEYAASVAEGSQSELPPPPSVDDIRKARLARFGA